MSGTELFTCPGRGRLFVDRGLAGHDPGATRQFFERVLAFPGRLV